MNIIALCDKDTAIGLRLAGVPNVLVPDEQQSTQQLWNTIEDDHTEIGLVIITEPIADTLGKQLEQFRIRNLLPIIIEIPDKHGRKTDHVDYVDHIIKKAVGMELKK